MDNKGIRWFYMLINVFLIIILFVIEVFFWKKINNVKFK